MCGLTGFWNLAADQSRDALQSIVSRMAATLHHRGPDDTGLWVDPAAGLALGFQRLSIVDLSPAGHQPMISASGRYVLVFNGEIYNHQDLRKELPASRSFRGHSDTEVLLAGFEDWGVESTLQRCVGMFAIALWDTESSELILARDRLGKKPLSYARFGPVVLFGSETKSLRAHPGFRGEIDRTALAQFLTYSYLPGVSIYEGVQVLPPGTCLRLPHREASFRTGGRFPTPVPYWEFVRVAETARQQPFAGTYEDAVERLDQLLRDAIGRRMLADVPLGAFLSGGIDSSTVVALMQQQSTQAVKTFTIGFEDPAYNEAPFAAQVAKHLGVDHTELTVTAKEARDTIPRLPAIFDEPFADSSQIPTLLVSQLARQHVTVALSGDGGDELFCGYRRYFDALQGYFDGASCHGAEQGLASRLARLSRRMPRALRRSCEAVLRTVQRIPLPGVSRRASFAADLFSDSGPHRRYLRNLTHWHEADLRALHLSATESAAALARLCQIIESRPGVAGLQQTWQAFDTMTYLPDDILTKVDRASMAVSLEARTPLLDHRIVEFAWSLPHEFKVEGATGKRILRSVLAKYVPPELFERPKVGFGVPIGDWLRGPLRDWAEDLLDERRLKREGFFAPGPIRSRWAQHQSGTANWQYALWDVLMFQAWLAESHRERLA